MSEWIKCSERMPAERQEVLFYDGHGIYAGYWEADGPHRVVYWTDGSEPWTAWQVTHWQPLPEPPHE